MEKKEMNFKPQPLLSFKGGKGKVYTTLNVGINKRVLTEDEQEVWECLTETFSGDITIEKIVEALGSDVLKASNDELRFIAESVDDTLNALKTLKIAQVEAYDDTEAVNSFTFSGVPLWLDVELRTRLKMRLEAEQALGMTQTKIWFGGMAFDLDINQARMLLQAVEVYASQCYDVTNAHIVAIKALDSVEAVEAYEYTKGYPQKLSF